MASSIYWVRRSARHVALLGVATGITWGAYAATPPPDVRHRLSMATAYAGLTFLAFSLSIGPWNVLARRPNPTSFDLRRDIGIWAGVLALVHTAIGLTVHLRGRMWMYFFKELYPLKTQGGETLSQAFSELLVRHGDFTLVVKVEIGCCRTGDQVPTPAEGLVLN